MAIPPAALADAPLISSDDIPLPSDTSPDSMMETMGPTEVEAATARDAHAVRGAAEDTALLTAKGHAQPTAPPNTHTPPSAAQAVAHTPAPAASHAAGLPPAARLGAAAALAVTLIAVAVWALSGPRDEAASAPTAAPTPPTAQTTPTATAAPTTTTAAAATTQAPSQPNPTADPTAAPAPQGPPRPATVTLPAAAVTLGLDDAQRRDLLTRFGDAYAFDLDAAAAALQRLTWQRPPLTVTQAEITWRVWRDWAGQVEPQTDCPTLGFPTQPDGAPDDAPVTSVTPVEAQRLCEALGMRLPSAREWEAIARGPADHAFGFAGDLSPDTLRALSDQRRAQSIPWSRTSEGVFDLASGAAEWVTCGDDGLRPPSAGRGEGKRI